MNSVTPLWLLKGYMRDPEMPAKKLSDSSRTLSACDILMHTTQ